MVQGFFTKQLIIENRVANPYICDSLALVRVLTNQLGEYYKNGSWRHEPRQGSSAQICGELNLHYLREIFSLFKK